MMPKMKVIFRSNILTQPLKTIREGDYIFNHTVKMPMVPRVGEIVQIPYGNFRVTEVRWDVDHKEVSVLLDIQHSY